MSKKILLTGGAGFIGSAIAAALVARGDKVIVLDKLTYAGHRQNLEWIEGGWELVVADVADEASVKKLFAKHEFDAIIHAAAESHVDNSIAGAAPFIRTNITGTQVLLEAALMQWQARDKPKDFRYLQVSTDEVYGTLDESGAFTLESNLAPNSPYAASKAAADLLVRAWHKTHGLPVLITRCCNNYGPRQHPEKLIPRMITNALKGEKLPVYGQGLQVREWIHVDDHAHGVLATLEKGKPGSVYHLGSGEERRNIDLVRHLCAVLAQLKPGKDYTALIGFVADRLGHDFRYALDVAPSEKELGFAPRVPFLDGLADTIAWYVDHPEWVSAMLAHKDAP